MSDAFGRRKSDSDFIVHASEEIGRLKEGYDYAAKGYQTVLAKVADIEDKIDGLRDALYGNGPDQIGIFERIRSLAVRVGVILFLLAGAGSFLGRFIEKRIFP